MSPMDTATFRIARFGTRLGTRLEGERARAELAGALRALPDGGQVRVVLDGLDVLSTSFADELIGRTYQHLVIGEFGERTMVLETPSAELADGIDVKLAQRRLAMLCLLNGAWSLIGQHTPAMDETLRLILEKGTTTTRELIEDLDLQMNACVNRVARLAKLRLIRRVQIGMNGPQPIYELHSILES